MPADTAKRVHAIREALKNIQDELLSLSEEIWKAIDHNDADALRAGVEFKQAFNEKRSVFETAANGLALLLSDYPKNGPGGERPPQAPEKPSPPRPIQLQPEQRQPPARNASSDITAEDFVEKRPFGFVLEERTFTGIPTWPLLYQTFLQEMVNRNRTKLLGLAEDNSFLAQDGGRMLSRTPEGLRKALPILDDLYAEGNLTPSLILTNIGRILSKFGIPGDAMRVLLKEERRGTVESKALAS